MRHVLAMTSAGSIGLMAIFLVDFLSLLYVSRLGDPNLTAAVGYATQILFFSVSIGIGLSIAIAALVARALGAGDRPRAQSLAGSCLVHITLMSALVGFAVLPFRSDVLTALGARGEALEVASAYLLITLPATVLLGIGMALAGVLRAVGDAKRAMFVTLSGGIATAILDPIFIFGLGLGVQGAAIVTIFSRIILVLVGLYGAVRIHGLIGRPERKAIIRDLPPMMTIAIPAILTNIAAPVANAYSMRIFSHFGEATVAAFAIIDRVSPLAFGVLFALSGSVGPIMSQNLGAGLIRRVRQTLTDSFTCAAIYVVLVSIILKLTAPLIIATFGASGDTERLVTFFCNFSGVLWLFLGGIFVTNAAFNNLGFPFLSTVFNWGRATLGTIPCVTLGASLNGPEGGFLGMIVGAAFFGSTAVGTAYFVIAQLAKRRSNA